MKNTNIKNSVTVKNSQVKTGERVQAGAEISTGAMIVTGSLGALIGTWAVACFIGGLVAAGGPLAFAKSWLTAVIGM